MGRQEHIIEIKREFKRGRRELGNRVMCGCTALPRRVQPVLTAAKRRLDSAAGEGGPRSGWGDEKSWYRENPYAFAIPAAGIVSRRVGEAKGELLGEVEGIGKGLAKSRMKGVSFFLVSALSGVGGVASLCSAFFSGKTLREGMAVLGAACAAACIAGVLLWKRGRLKAYKNALEKTKSMELRIGRALEEAQAKIGEEIGRLTEDWLNRFEGNVD